MIEEIVEKVKETLGFEPNKRTGANPHATFEQGRPAVNKDEPASFANPVEAGAKKFSEESCGKPMPAAFDIQPGQDFACPSDAHTRMGSDPHATFEQGHPAVNKEEPRSFANPCEAGAKKPSEAQFGKPMPDLGQKTSCQ